MYNNTKRYKMKGTTDGKHVPRRERPIRTKRLIDIVRKRVQRNGRRSMRATVKELNISQTTMMRIVKDDLRLKALEIQCRQLISASKKQKQLDRGRKMFAKISSACNKVFIWLYEKMFTSEAVSNS